MLIITDPHGCFLTFKKLYEEVTEKFPGEPVVISGDLVDRGPRTKELIEFVIENKIQCIKGNHDDFMSDPAQLDTWLYNGGIRAFQSYCLCEEGTDTRGFGFIINPDHVCEGTQLLEMHKEFLRGLPFYLEYKEIKHQNGRHLLITHAPIRHGKLENQLKHHGWDGMTFIWNRQTPPRSNVQKWFNVHGHTPHKKPIVTEWYANIDTGCAYADRGYGLLTCLRFPQMELFEQKNIE